MWGGKVIVFIEVAVRGVGITVWDAVSVFAHGEDYDSRRRQKNRYTISSRLPVNRNQSPNAIRS